MKISKIYVVIILITIIFALIGGCGNSRKLNEGPVTLRLLTEDYPDSYGLSDTNPMSLVVRYLIDEYEAAHDGISIELEMLPSAPEEREARLEELRTEIMSGGGPDIYLLQGSGDDALFSDATQAMRNGLFYDINTLYESDDGLGKEALVAAVMNAGAIGNARYILPLRYNFPMVYTTEAALKAAGLDVEKISTGVNILYDTLAATGDPDWTRYSWPWYYNSSLCVFPNIIDYETQTVSLSTGEVMEYLQRIQALSNAGITYPMSSSWDIYASLSQYPLNDGIVEFQKAAVFLRRFYMLADWTRRWMWRSSRRLSIWSLSCSPSAPWTALWWPMLPIGGQLGPDVNTRRLPMTSYGFCSWRTPNGSLIDLPRQMAVSVAVSQPVGRLEWKDR